MDDLNNVATPLHTSDFINRQARATNPKIVGMNENENNLGLKAATAVTYTSGASNNASTRRGMPFGWRYTNTVTFA
jgi:hypothetical protein